MKKYKLDHGFTIIKIILVLAVAGLFFFDGVSCSPYSRAISTRHGKEK